MTAKAARSCFTSADGFPPRTVKNTSQTNNIKALAMKKNVYWGDVSRKKTLRLPFMLEWLWIKACLLLYRATQCLIKVATGSWRCRFLIKNHCFVTVPKGFYCRRDTKQNVRDSANLKKLSSGSQISWSVSGSLARHQWWLHVMKKNNIPAVSVRHEAALSCMRQITEPEEKTRSTAAKATYETICSSNCWGNLFENSHDASKNVY